jgi:hypothetical protein
MLWCLAQQYSGSLDRALPSLTDALGNAALVRLGAVKVIPRPAHELHHVLVEDTRRIACDERP